MQPNSTNCYHSWSVKGTSTCWLYCVKCHLEITPSLKLVCTRTEWPGTVLPSISTTHCVTPRTLSLLIWVSTEIRSISQGTIRESISISGVFVRCLGIPSLTSFPRNGFILLPNIFSSQFSCFAGFCRYHIFLEK